MRSSLSVFVCLVLLLSATLWISAASLAQVNVSANSIIVGGSLLVLARPFLSAVSPSRHVVGLSPSLRAGILLFFRGVRFHPFLT